MKTKGESARKSTKSGKRGGKCLKGMDLPRKHRMHRERLRASEILTPTPPPRVCMDVKRKGLREKGFVRV